LTVPGRRRHPIHGYGYRAGIENGDWTASGRLAGVKNLAAFES
jgi:hypothetical protein